VTCGESCATCRRHPRERRERPVPSRARGAAGLRARGASSAGQPQSDWLPPADAPQQGTDPFGRAWERQETSSRPAWPSAQEPAAAPSTAASWPGGSAAPAGASGSPASWGNRALATLLDGLITTLIALIPAAIGAIGFVAGEGLGFAGLFTGLAIGVVLSLLYAPYLLANRNGQTIGKKAMKIRVVKGDRSKISMGDGLLREFVVKGLLVGAVGSFTLYILPLLNYLWPLWDEHKHALHDKLVKTEVVEA
jgi:uncharacterized RDD family membrane protein YckC